MAKGTYTVRFVSLKDLEDTIDRLFEKIETLDPETESGMLMDLINVIRPMDAALKSRRLDVTFGAKEGKLYIKFLSDQFMDTTRLKDLRRALKYAERTDRL